METTHRQLASCRARAANVDYDPEDIRWIRGLLVRGEKLPAASYALLPKDIKKVNCFAIGAGSRYNCSFFTQQRPIVFASNVWPAPVINQRPFWKHFCPWSRVGRDIDTCVFPCCCAFVVVENKQQYPLPMPGLGSKGTSRPPYSWPGVGGNIHTLFSCCVLVADGWLSTRVRQP